MTPSKNVALKLFFATEVQAFLNILDFLRMIIDKSNIVRVQKPVRDRQHAPAYYSPAISDAPQDVMRIERTLRTI